MADVKTTLFSDAIIELKANFLGATVDIITHECVNMTPEVKKAVQAVSAAAVAGGRKVASTKYAVQYNQIVSFAPLNLQGKVNMRRLTVIGLALLSVATDQAKAIVRKKLGAILPSEFSQLDAVTQQQKILKQAVIDSELTDQNAGEIVALFN